MLKETPYFILKTKKGKKKARRGESREQVHDREHEPGRGGRKKGGKKSTPMKTIAYCLP